MHDYSNFLIFGLLALGSLVAISAGLAMRSANLLAGVVVTALAAIGIAVSLMVVIGWTWDACAETLHLCKATTDMTVWTILVYPLLQAPVNWCLMLACRLKKV